MAKVDFEKATQQTIDRMTGLGDAAVSMAQLASQSGRDNVYDLAMMVAESDFRTADIAMYRAIPARRLTPDYDLEFQALGIPPIVGENLVYAIHGLQEVVTGEPGRRLRPITSHRLQRSSPSWYARTLPSSHPQVDGLLGDIFSLVGFDRDTVRNWPQGVSQQSYRGGRVLLSEQRNGKRVSLRAGVLRS